MVAYLRSDGSIFENSQPGYCYYIFRDGTYADFKDYRKFMQACAVLDRNQSSYRIGNITTRTDWN